MDTLYLVYLSVLYIFHFSHTQAINVIQDLEHNKDSSGDYSRNTEPFSSWWNGVAATSLAKMQTMQRSPGQPVRFAALGQPTMLEAYIDPEDKLNHNDKLSQVRFYLFILNLYCNWKGRKLCKEKISWLMKKKTEMKKII